MHRPPTLGQGSRQLHVVGVVGLESPVGFYALLGKIVDSAGVFTPLALALSGLLAPTLEEHVVGAAEVRQIFTTSRAGTMRSSADRAGAVQRTGGPGDSSVSRSAGAASLTSAVW